MAPARVPCLWPLKENWLILIRCLQGNPARPGSVRRYRRAVAEQIDPVTEATLFVADHAAHLATVVRPALDNKKLVISDRYSDSRFAYQSVTLDGVIPDPDGWLRAMHNGWSIVPDKTILLVIPVDEALARLAGKTGREHFERREVLEKVQDRYLAFARMEPSRFVVVDALLEKEEIACFVAEAIRFVLQSSQSRRRL